MNPKRSARALAVVAAVLGLSGFMAIPSYAAGKSAGAATIVDPRSNEALSSGGSQTTFGFKLPAPPKSNCSGDSAHDAFFVYTYFVSDSVSPGDVMFNPNIGVDPIDGRIALPIIDANGSPFISRNTAQDTGQVLSGPVGFKFDRLSIDGSTAAKIDPGTYNVGMACWDAKSKQQDKFWNAQVRFKASKSDPTGLVWETTASRALTNSSGPSGLTIGLIVIVVVGGTATVMRRRSRPLSKAGK